MKKITLVIFYCYMISVLPYSIFAQQKTNNNKKSGSPQQITELTEANKSFYEAYGVVRCLTVENERDLQRKHPNRATKEEFERILAPIVEKIKEDIRLGRSPQIVYNIPVVVHVIHNGDPINTPGNIYGENISDAQVLSQIQVLNEDFRRLAGTPGGANSTGVAVDVEINFCLAQQDTNGNPTSGIVRHNITPYNNNVADGAGGPDWETKTDVEQMKTVTQWDPTKYMNMWSIRAGGLPISSGGLGDLLGYAQFPDASGLPGINAIGGAANTDGVVAGFDAFGTIAEDDGSFVMNGTYDLGRTMTHEVGHWLGLRHIWGDTSACTNGDYCADTPDSTTSNGACITIDRCPSDGLGNDMVQNYMDYTPDSCMDTFTADQKARMVAVMQNSPRRMELNSSIGCNAVTPIIRFGSAYSSEAEGSSCNYRDINVTVTIAKAPSDDATITFTNPGGTATNGTDFDIQTPSVVFGAGSTASQTLTLRIYEDSFEETNETLTIGMSISTTGDATISTIGNHEFTLTLTDDDARNNGVTTVFSEDFESYTDFETGNIGGWGMNDGDGNVTYSIQDVTFPNQAYTGTFIVFNPDQVTSGSLDSSWDAHGGDKSYNCFAATSTPGGTALNDDHIFTPQISLSGTGSQLKFWAKSITSQYGLERFNVKVSTAADTDNLGSFTTIAPSTPAPGGLSYEEAPTTWTEYTYDLSAYDGMTVFIAFHCVSADAYVFMLDDISVTTSISLGVQTTVSTPDQNALSGMGTIYANNGSNNNFIVDITNNGNDDYGCVSTNVSRAYSNSTPAVQYQTAGMSNYVMAKTITVAPTLTNASGNATLKFYFTEEEISEWESATGNNRSELVIIKDNGSSSEAVTTSIGAASPHVTLEGTFTSGINGTYYFGKMSALSTDEHSFSVFTVSPNPTSGEVSIILSTNDDVALNLYDISGRVIYNKRFANSSATFEKTIDFGDLASGIYIFKVKSGNKTATKRLIKN